MVTSPTGSSRTGVLPLLLVAVLAGLVVAGAYEIRGRRASGPSAPVGDASTGAASQVAPAALSERRSLARDESCATLRQRYLSRCSGDVLAAAPPPGQPASSDKPLTPEAEARATAELAAWLRPTPAELSDMAKRCEVRFVVPSVTENQPPPVSDRQSAALSLSKRERTLLEQTLRDMHAGLRDFTTRAFVDGGGQPAKAAALTFEDLLDDLQMRPENGFEAAREKLAQERGGVVPPPKPGTDQPPGERLIRWWAGMGDEFERRLADGLGTERAHQLRFSPHASWTNRFSQTGCK